MYIYIYIYVYIYIYIYIHIVYCYIHETCVNQRRAKGALANGAIIVIITIILLVVIIAILLIIVIVAFLLIVVIVERGVGKRGIWSKAYQQVSTRVNQHRHLMLIPFDMC